MSHGNARTTFHGRLLIVQRHRAGWPHAHIAAAMGVSRKCVKTWVDRFAAEGPDGLRDRSSRPHTMPTRTSPEVEAAVVELRRRERRGPAWIGAELGVPARTVLRVLVRHGVPRLCMLDPVTGELIRASKATTIRYEHDRPGSLVHMDVKKLGRIPTAEAGARRGKPPPTTAPEPARPPSATTTCTPWSTTTHGWPTQRSFPTRKARPAQGSSTAPWTTSPPTTTLFAVTAHSEATHPSADCYNLMAGYN